MTGKRKEATRYAHIIIKPAGLVEEVEELCVLGLPTPKVHVGDLKFGPDCGWMRVVRSVFRHLECTERWEREQEGEREKGWRREERGRRVGDWCERRGMNVDVGKEHGGCGRGISRTLADDRRREALACGTYAVCCHYAEWRNAHPWSVGDAVDRHTRRRSGDGYRGDVARSLPAYQGKARSYCFLRVAESFLVVTQQPKPAQCSPLLFWMPLSPEVLPPGGPYRYLYDMTVSKSTKASYCRHLPQLLILFPASSPDPRATSTFTACLLSEDHDSATQRGGGTLSCFLGRLVFAAVLSQPRRQTRNDFALKRHMPAPLVCSLAIAAGAHAAHTASEGTTRVGTGSGSEAGGGGATACKPMVGQRVDDRLAREARGRGRSVGEVGRAGRFKRRWIFCVAVAAGVDKAPRVPMERNTGFEAAHPSRALHGEFIPFKDRF
ncbi:hypothetical protein B0H19DRAFT_1235325 [Mycena capillaripes]|nr:hypothetical protein B0H19DRAFT_1235325 [Mycena capillaripes]